MNPGLAIAAATLLSMGWGLLSRKVMSWHDAGVMSFKNPAAVAAVLSAQATQGRGLYQLPLVASKAPQETGDQTRLRLEQQEKSMDAGPYFHGFVRPAQRFSEPQDFWLALTLRSLLLALGLSQVVRVLPLSKLAAMACCASLGALGGLTVQGNAALWLEWPWREVLVAMAENTLEWALVGGLLAAILGRPLSVRDSH
jgi:hypothetical protein